MEASKHEISSPTALHETSAPSQEVRCAVRFPLVLPVELWTGQEEIAALTRNVSASGVLFELDRPLQAGLSIHFSLRMPGAVLGTPHDVLVHCGDVWYAARRTKVTIWLPPLSTSTNSQSSDGRGLANQFRLDDRYHWTTLRRRNS